MSISQSDLNLIKTLHDGIEYLRQNAWQLDFIIEDVLSDHLKTHFGQQEIARFKRWFLTTQIPVHSVYRIDKPQYPCITVSVKSSIEAPDKAALGEEDPQVLGTNEVEKSGYIKTPDIMLGPFSPGYDADTGTVTLPDGYTTELVFVNQGLYVPEAGEIFTITEITGDQTFVIDEGLHINMKDSYVAPAYDTLKLIKRIANFNETYEINCIVKGEPGELYWLHSIVSYILLQRRQYLLEKYNIGLTSISSGEMQSEESGAGETFFYRSITMAGYAEVKWVDDLSEFIEGISGTVTFAQNTNSSTAPPQFPWGGGSFSTSVAASNVGEQGPQGETGPQGPAGPIGATGATGATGAAGEPGSKVAGMTWGDGVASDSVTLALNIPYYVRIPYGAQISQWDLVSDISCSCTIDIWKSAGSIPTISNTIVAGNYPALNSSTVGESSTLTGWTVNIAAGDVLAFVLSSISGTPKQIALTLRMTAI